MVCGSHGVRQLGAVLRKNALVKRRNLKLTFCELLSPPLFIGILVLGYFLTDPDYFTAAIYVRLQVSLNPLLQARLGNQQGMTENIHSTSTTTPRRSRLAAMQANRLVLISADPTFFTTRTLACAFHEENRKYTHRHSMATQGVSCDAWGCQK
eukprot:6193415-Pleurochrysis_carterae.AAC.3